MRLKPFDALSGGQAGRLHVGDEAAEIGITGKPLDVGIDMGLLRTPSSILGTLRVQAREALAVRIRHEQSLSQTP